jgi:chitin disaccharide deacetylase
MRSHSKESDAKLLIVHADDLGMAHSVNAAAMAAFEAGSISSGSIMVPCDWFEEIAEYAKNRPDLDIGLHLTLTSEWDVPRWRPVAARRQVASILDPDGFFHRSVAAFAACARMDEVEVELRAQIDRALASGVTPTHLDSHMFALYHNQALLETFARVARAYNLPFLMARAWHRIGDGPTTQLPSGACFDWIIQAWPEVAPNAWPRYYNRILRAIPSGVTLLIVHPAYDDSEMRALSKGQAAWGAAWRERDFNYISSRAFRPLVRRLGFRLVGYRDLANTIAAG